MAGDERYEHDVQISVFCKQKSVSHKINLKFRCKKKHWKKKKNLISNHGCWCLKTKPKPKNIN